MGTEGRRQRVQGVSTPGRRGRAASAQRCADDLGFDELSLPRPARRDPASGRRDPVSAGCARDLASIVHVKHVADVALHVRQ